AKLADFGLAKLAEESLSPTDWTKTSAEALTECTRSGIIIGTVAYMSPEQAQGQVIDSRSDIFSFGVVLYELLAVRRPFDGRNDLETIQKVIHEAPPPLGDDIPSELRAFVEKALERSRDQRYQSMREMVVDLRSLVRTNDAQTRSTPEPTTAAASE